MIPPKITDLTDGIDGACLCGAVRFRIALPPKWVAHCHCSMCRRAHGAPYVTWVGVATPSFTLTHGADTLRSYASSPAATREFCGRCGSPLFFRSLRWSDEVHVARAAIAGDVGTAPQSHAFFSDRAAWVQVDEHDGLPRRGGASGTDDLSGPLS